MKTMKGPAIFLAQFAGDREPFNALPGEMKEYVYGRLRAVLSGRDRSPEFAHLSESDRQVVLAILEQTDIATRGQR